MTETIESAASPKKLNTADILTAIWTGVILALLVFRNVPNRKALIVSHLAILVWVALVPKLRKTRLGWFTYWYPLGLSAFFFEEIHSLVHSIRTGWNDPYLIAADYWLFGAHPTVWFEAYITPALTEILSFFYFAYWPLIPAVAALIWFRQREEFVDFVTRMSLAYIICYVVFILFPVEGPFHTLRGLQKVEEMPGGPFKWIVDEVEKRGRIHGAAFPSAHVAGSFIALFGAWRFSKMAGLVAGVIVTGMCVATVYGRYHYAADIWGGITVAVIAEAIYRLASAARHET